MPGASLRSLTSGPSTLLVSSVSTPVLMIIARFGEPEPLIAAANPAEIERTDTKTITTPAIPIIATVDEPRRAGIVRRLTINTAIVCLSQFIGVFLSFPQSFSDSQTHRTHRRHDTCRQAHEYHQREANKIGRAHV